MICNLIIHSWGQICKAIRCYYTTWRKLNANPDPNHNSNPNHTLPSYPDVTKTSCEHNGPIRKTSSSAYRPLINPPPSLRKISYKYKSMLTYIPVSFLFSFIFRVRARVKNRVRVRVSFRVRVRVRVWDR